MLGCVEQVSSSFDHSSGFLGRGCGVRDLQFLHSSRSKHWAKIIQRQRILPHRYHFWMYDRHQYLLIRYVVSGPVLGDSHTSIGMILQKIWSVERAWTPPSICSVRHLPQRSRLKLAKRIVVESGLLYTTITVLMFITQLSKSPGAYILCSTVRTFNCESSDLNFYLCNTKGN